MNLDPVFGDGYTAERIDLGVDAEGPVVATVVHRLRRPEDADGRAGASGRPLPPILVGHGWSDYVFDRDLLDHLGARGFDVWALDLRKHGRSLLPGQTPTLIDNLSRYDEEFGEALRIIGTDRPPVVLAHSTGGLTAALWAQRHPGTVRALAMNSPWLEMHLGPAARMLVEGPVRALAERLQGRPILPPGNPFYARTTHRDYGGLYDYDLDLKPPRGHRFPAQTLAAVLDGQTRLAAADPLTIPVLVMHSSRSRIGVLFTEEMRRSDSVLDVHVIREAARRLGPDVWIEAIDGARHDVFMSDADARVRAITVLDSWLDQVAAQPHTMSALEGRTGVGEPGPEHGEEDGDALGFT